MDIESGKTNIAYDFSISSANLVPADDNKFIVFGSGLKNTICIYELLVTDKINIRELCLIPNMDIYANSAVISDKDIFFCTKMNGAGRIRNGFEIVSFNVATGEWNHCFNIEEILGYKANFISKFGYFTSMCISKNKRYILIGLSDSIIGVDLFDKKHIGTIRIDCVSSLKFISSDKKVLIGTWSNIRIIDFATLFL